MPEFVDWVAWCRGLAIYDPDMPLTRAADELGRMEPAAEYPLLPDTELWF
jgi:hypothetical protein